MAKLQLEDGSFIDVPDDASQDDVRKYFNQVRTFGLPQQKGNNTPTPYDTNPGGQAVSQFGHVFKSDVIDPIGHMFGMAKDVVTDPENHPEGILPDMLEGMFKGIFHNPDPQHPVERGMENIPIIGRGIQAGRRLVGDHDPAGALADMAGLGLDWYGPKALEGAAAATTGRVGNAFERAGLGKMLDQNLDPDVKAGIVSRGQAEGVKPAYGTGGKIEAARLGPIQIADRNAVQQMIANHVGPNIHIGDVATNVKDAIADIVDFKGEEAATPLVNDLVGFYKKHSGDAPAKINLGGGKSRMETPMEFIDRVDRTDPGASLDYWMKVNEKANRVEKTGKALTPIRELQSQGQGQNVFDTLANSGIREETRSALPGLQEAQQQVYQVGQLRAGLSKLAKKDPSQLVKLAPLILGVGTGMTAAGLGKVFGMHGGMAPLEFAGAMTAAGLIRTITASALRDPVIMARTGRALQGYGYGPMGTVMKHAPKAGLFVSGQDQPQERK